MLRRAFAFVIIALLAALVAQSGWLEPKQSWAWGVCYAALGWAVLSLMFSLFEDAEVEEPGQQLTSSPEESHNRDQLVDWASPAPNVLKKAHL